MRQPPARENKVDATGGITTDDKTTYSLQWTTWHNAPLCKLLVCGVHVLDGTETHEDMFEENAQTEARDARCPHASELKQSIFSSHCQGDVHIGMGQRGQGPRQ